MSLTVDYRNPFRRPLTRRTLLSLISSLQDDIAFSETQIETSNEVLARCNTMARELKFLKDALIESGDFCDARESKISAALTKHDENIAQCKTLIHANEVMIKDRRETLAQAEELLRQMPD